MTKIILIRHGMSKSNENKTFTGQGNSPLNETGLKQAQLTARYISENYTPDIIYASDLERAYRTGQAVADIFGMSVIPNKNLREINAGAWEGCTFTELTERFGDSYAKFRGDIGNAVCDGGESVRELAERVTSEIRAIAEANSGKTVVIATHATPIRAVMCVFQNRPVEDMKDIPWVSNASVTVMNIENDTVTFEKISEDSHLDSLITVLPQNV